MSVSDGQTVKLWSAETGELYAVLRPNEEELVSSAFSPEGVSVIVGGKQKLSIFNTMFLMPIDLLFDRARGGPGRGKVLN
jgi:WD40 repeat protein